MPAVGNPKLRVTDKTGLVHAVIDGHTFCGRPVVSGKSWEPKKGDHFEICITCAHREIQWFNAGNRYEATAPTATAHDTE